ncbi:phosphotransferase family protein [Aestuariicella hydrocarbonica]|uniref:Phosphotransferase family protein n=1 Tax=Pseudomaricurvus hydrocarbonicus TaxID=1470433 RepID=A0A9E5JWD7_9GAMM|nr:phosphotransferase family protein [Aestuariicella hydrocarbonica]NHO66721.1 phosphotransferase family protein [Aestuariicella hydrocarbonica]
MAKLELLDETEIKIRNCIETLVGGTVTAMERQVRWRPSWFVDVICRGETLKLYVRGDRESDVVPFPELKREADILSVLGENGIPAPRIYGMCDDPVAIIMESVPGTRDVASAATDEERRDVARQYIDALVAMHNLPVEKFTEIGIDLPQGAEEIAQAGIKAYLPLYQKNKVAPEPLIEFAMRWLCDNVPQHRTKPSFIAFDAGQFLFDQGEIKAVYDLEFAMIGDPMTDLATMAMRHSYEPTGEAISVLCDYYAEVSGVPVEEAVVRYHHAVFSTVACMQFAGAIQNPKPGDPHDVYLEWDLALRRTLLNALAKNVGVTLQTPAKLLEPNKRNQSLHSMIDDMAASFETHNELQQASKECVLRLLDYAQIMDQYADQLDELALTEAVSFVGKCESMPELQQKLEEFVQQAGAEHDQELIQYFHNQLTRKIQVCSEIGIGRSAIHIEDDILA